MTLGDTLDRRKVFSRMTEKDRDMALFDMFSGELSERVKLEKRIIELENDNRFMKGTLEAISHRKTDTLEMDTTGKIKAFMASRFDVWMWFRDKVLPNVITFITMGILYLVFSGKLP